MRRSGRLVAVFTAMTLSITGLSACGARSSSDAAEDFLTAVADGDVEAIGKYVDGDKYKIADVKPDNPIKDVKVEDTGTEDKVKVGFKTGGKSFETTVAMTKTDDGWRINPEKILPEVGDMTPEVQTRINGKQISSGEYLLPGTYHATAEGGYWTAEWDVDADSTDDTGAIGMGVPEEAEIKVNDKIKTDETVLEDVREELTADVDSCDVLSKEMLNGKGFALIAGESISKACKGNGITNADKVTITGWEDDPDSKNVVILTLGGTYTGNKATFQNVDDDYELSRQGWICQYADGIPTKQQCALYGSADLPADGLTVKYRVNPDRARAYIPQETVQKVADALYEGHAYD